MQSSADDDRKGRRVAALHGIYAIVEPERRAPQAYVEALLAGGVRLFQIRAKSGVAPALLAAVVAMVRASGGITLVNDDVRAAQSADGLHLGQEDAAVLDLHAVRAQLANGIIGLSCGTPAQASAVDARLIDYIGVGPLFETASKADAGSPLGVTGVRAVIDAGKLPAAAIGGITLASISIVRETGATMAAIISALSNARDVTQTARDFISAWNA